MGKVEMMLMSEIGDRIRKMIDIDEDCVDSRGVGRKMNKTLCVGMFDQNISLG